MGENTMGSELKNIEVDFKDAKIFELQEQLADQASHYESLYQKYDQILIKELISQSAQETNE